MRRLLAPIALAVFGSACSDVQLECPDEITVGETIHLIYPTTGSQAVRFTIERDLDATERYFPAGGEPALLIDGAGAEAPRARVDAVYGCAGAFQVSDDGLCARTVPLVGKAPGDVVVRADAVDHGATCRVTVVPAVVANDAGVDDAMVPDADRPDSGFPDANLLDVSGSPDAAGSTDSGPTDTGPTIEPSHASTYGLGSATSVARTPDDGVVIAGDNNLLGLDSRQFWVMKASANGAIPWLWHYGASASKGATAVLPTPDGGYIVAGYSSEFGAGEDAWVLKLAADGMIEWQRNYGGPGDDRAYAIQLASSGGYILAGMTGSFGRGVRDVWVLRLDATGAVMWQSAYGAVDVDEARSVVEVAGGFVVGALSRVSGRRAFAFVNLGPDGTLLGTTSVGGDATDSLRAMTATDDGGVIAVGITDSFGNGRGNAWIVKLTATSTVQWQKVLTGTTADDAVSVRQTADLGYVVAGSTTNAGAGGADGWVVKLAPDGVIEWQRTYGGAGYDRLLSIEQTADGGYVAVGNTTSDGSSGRGSIWILYLRSDGSIGNGCALVGISAATAVDTTAVPGTGTAITSTVTTAAGAATTAALTVQGAGRLHQCD